MKKFLSLILALSMVLSMATVVVAEDDIKVTIDGVPQSYDVMPVLDNDRTLVPMRGIFEALGAEISWEEATETVTGVKGDITVVLQIGNTTAKVNGADVILDVPAKLINDRTMVPVRFISESLGCKVDWEDATQTVIITSPVEEEKTVVQEMLDGKKVLFLGNSWLYYGRLVQNKGTNVLEQAKRSNDKGIFYQLCKALDCEVSVTNWSFSAHALGDLLDDPCTRSTCAGVTHGTYLTDRHFDYVIASPGSGTGGQEANIIKNFETIIDTFSEVNPDVQVICLGNLGTHGYNSSNKAFPGIKDAYKTIENMGVIIADWGGMVKDIIEGNCTVPLATQTYNRKSFVVKDNYHPNHLTGYLEALFAVCAITQESAVDMPYQFFGTTAEPSIFDMDAYINSYYNSPSDTNYPKILASFEDMAGLQKLVDQYLAEKPYR